jgi:hypothetical protein
MKEKQSTKTISTIAAIVVACYSVTFGLIGYLGRNSFAPKIIDEMFGISKYVLKEIDKKVDSGYTGTFIFTPDAVNKTQQLVFYAEEGQKVKVTIKAHATGPQANKLRVLIDKVPWAEDRVLPIEIIHGDITKLLKFDDPGANLHFLKPSPVEELQKDTIMVIECLVLVYNK